MGVLVGGRGGRDGGRDGLCSDARAPGEGVEGDALAEEEFTSGAADCCNIFDGIEFFAFFHVPFDAVGRLVLGIGAGEL